MERPALRLTLDETEAGLTPDDLVTPRAAMSPLKTPKTVSLTALAAMGFAPAQAQQQQQQQRASFAAPPQLPLPLPPPPLVVPLLMRCELSAAENTNNNSNVAQFFSSLFLVCSEST